MKNLFFGILFCCLASIVLSCKSKTNKADVGILPVNDTAKFYPVNVFINQDIDSVSKSAFTIVKKLTVNKQTTDSVVITVDEFKKLAASFLKKDITQPQIKKWYKENIFRNLNTNSIVFNYTTPNKDLEVQGIDVNVNDEDSKLNRLDMRVFTSKNDSSIKENYTWVQGKKFYVSSYAEGKNGNGTSSTIEVAWYKK